MNPPQLNTAGARSSFGCTMKKALTTVNSPGQSGVCSGNYFYHESRLLEEIFPASARQLLLCLRIGEGYQRSTDFGLLALRSLFHISRPATGDREGVGTPVCITAIRLFLKNEQVALAAVQGLQQDPGTFCHCRQKTSRRLQKWPIPPAYLHCSRSLPNQN